MLRPVITLAALGAVGIVAWQLVWGLLLPLVAGILALVIKVVFWAGVIALVIWAFRRLFPPSESPA
jgi:hypothetical protein